MNTFCKAYDWNGKRVQIFATSGGSGIGKSGEKLMPYIKGAKILGARRVAGADELRDWADAVRAE